MSQPKKPGPFAGHRLYAGHSVGIARQFLKFGEKLRLDSYVHALEITRRALVDDQLRHSLRVPRAV
jgi:hypothetical protein